MALIRPAQQTQSQSCFGELCAALLQRSAQSDREAPKLSIVHVWVHGSYTRLGHAWQWANKEVLSRVTGRVRTIPGDPNSHFRCVHLSVLREIVLIRACHRRAHDGLVYPLRSVMKSLAAVHPRDTVTVSSSRKVVRSNTSIPQ